MGFFYRKSVSFGPIRLNFSKSGVGVSAGVRGARVSAGPSGTYVHAGTNGFYYRQRIDGSRTSSRPRSPRVSTYTANSPFEDFEIHSADVSRFVETSNAKVVEEINARLAETRYAPIVAVLTILSDMLATVATSRILFLLSFPDRLVVAATVLAGCLVGALGLYMTWKVHKGDQLKRTTPLFYELDEASAAKFTHLNRTNEVLSRAQRIWRVQTQMPTWDWKRNAGASSLLTRTPVDMRRQQPPYIATNVDAWCLSLNDQQFYFMPDYVFVRQRGLYGLISYPSFRVDFSTTRFIEEEGVPLDARILDYTWRYVNKKGGPDRRFSNNRQIPVVEYGFLHFGTTAGLNIHLHVSSPAAGEPFFRYFNPSRGSAPRFDNQRRDSEYDPKPSSRTVDSRVRAAMEILEVSLDATPQHITAAYRQMAKMYHPDRLAHLAPEFVEMAEERMKEINLAYQTLKETGYV